MDTARLRVVAAAAFVLLLAACEQEQNAAQTEVQESAPPTIATVIEPAAPPPPVAPAPIPLATELPVNAIDSVMLSRAEDAPSALIIRVLGTAASGGWSLPKLELVEDNRSDGSIISYQFVATSPEASDDTNTAGERIEAELRVESLPPDVMTIRIVSATNEVSAPVAQ
jgi:hypothetical protein